MKLIASGVTYSAAITRSPSFSRSGESTTTTMRPARISSSASSTVANGDSPSSSGYELLVALRRRSSGHPPDGTRGPRKCRAFRRTLRSTSASRLTRSPGASAPSVVTSSVCGMTDDREAVVVDAGDGQADAGHGDRALLDRVAQHLGRAPRSARLTASPSGSPTPLADAVHVALHPVAAQPVADAQRRLEVDAVAGRAARRASCAAASRHRVEREHRAVDRGRPSGSSRRPRPSRRRRRRRADQRRLQHQVGRAARTTVAQLDDDAREHLIPPEARQTSRISGPTAPARLQRATAGQARSASEAAARAGERPTVRRRAGRWRRTAPPSTADVDQRRPQAAPAASVARALDQHRRHPPGGRAQRACGASRVRPGRRHRPRSPGRAGRAGRTRRAAAGARRADRRRAPSAAGRRRSRCRSRPPRRRRGPPSRAPSAAALRRADPLGTRPPQSPCGRPAQAAALYVTCGRPRSGSVRNPAFWRRAGRLQVAGRHVDLDPRGAQRARGPRRRPCRWGRAPRSRPARRRRRPARRRTAACARGGCTARGST